MNKFFLILVSLTILIGIGERIGEVAWPDVGNQYFHAHSGGDAADTTLALTYSVVNTSWTEHFDKRNCFTVSVSENEVCYDCVHDIQVQIVLAISVQRTVGAGVDHVTMSMGKDTTGNISDGDEAGFEQFERDFSSTGAHSMGSFTATSLMETDQCLSLMAKADNTGGGADFNFLAVTIDIVEP